MPDVTPRIKKDGEMNNVMEAVECPECAGIGACCGHDPCHRCKGKGEVWRPSVPLPLYGGWLWWKWYGCTCGQRFKSEDAYVGHYRMQHIPQERPYWADAYERLTGEAWSPGTSWPTRLGPPPPPTDREHFGIPERGEGSDA